MNRSEYNNARREIRTNGKAYALRMMSADTRTIMEALIYSKDDRLAERADIMDYCKRKGFACNIRHTK